MQLRRCGHPQSPAQSPASPVCARSCFQRRPAHPSAAAPVPAVPDAVYGQPNPGPLGPSPQSMRGMGSKQERLLRSLGHTGHSARLTRLYGSCSALWSGDTEVCLFHEGHSHRLQERADHRVRVPVEHPRKPPSHPGPVGLPRHCNPGSPQWSSWHSEQVRPPKPARQWHCPVN